MNLNRLQRRALQVQGRSTSLGQTTGQLQQALATLQSMKGLTDLPERLTEAHRLMVEAHATVLALVDDCQGMADETEALKAMLFEVVGSTAEEMFERHLAKVKEQRGQAPDKA